MAHRKLIGEQAPSVTLPNYDGETYTLEFTPGVPTAIFFYPKAGSYGCTKEACQFRDAIAEKNTFAAGKVQIVGISADPVEKQKAFVEKHKLTYPVLSDANGEARKAYGIGKGLFGLAETARVTVIVDGKGVIRDTTEGTLNYGAHSKFVTKWLDKLEAEAAKSAETETVPAAEAAPAPAAEPAPAPAATEA
ncbi:Peroxiredoxin Q [Mycena chlorophos]|uniref:thioredoxin-dependent peroxiredoxin n=1 Tax=Mycena chlorophos TaxID=658473 RepID=A0A8H6RY85_MYCCL|nr:Peroxiredoxin Q [Mycena chlorophos]